MAAPGGTAPVRERAVSRGRASPGGGSASVSPRLAAVLQQQVLAKATREVAPAARRQSGELRVARRSSGLEVPYRGDSESHFYSESAGRIRRTSRGRTQRGRVRLGSVSAVCSVLATHRQNPPGTRSTCPGSGQLRSAGAPKEAQQHRRWLALCTRGWRGPALDPPTAGCRTVPLSRANTCGSGVPRPRGGGWVRTCRGA